MADDDPFADLAASIKSPVQAGQAGSDQADPFADLAGRIQKGEPEPPLPPQTGMLEAAGVHAATSAVPAVGVLGGAALGAEIGAPAGPLGSLVGGLGGALVGGYLGGKAQDTAVEALPDTWKDPLKQELETTEKEHPYMSMLGGLVPYIATMNPMAAAKTGPVAATAIQRLMNNPTTARVFGGILQGGLELEQEYQSGSTPDWAKVGIATGFGLIWNRPNRIGEMIEKGAVRPFEPVFTAAQNMRRGMTDYPRAPTIANVDAANVAGPGVTEEVATGELKRNEAAEQTAQDAARTEASIIGPRPEPDLHAAVERMNPEAVVARDHFEATAKTLRDAEVPNPALIAETQQALRGARQEVGDAYARAAESKGVEPVAPEVRQTAPNNANQRQAIADDVSRQLTAAGRPADEAEAHGQLIAERYAARASHLGVPVDELYRAEGARIVGPGVEPPTPPTPALTIAERQKAAFARGPRSMDANGVITEEPLPTIATPPTEANPEGGETLAPGALIGAEAPLPTVTDRRGNEWRQIGPNSDGQMLWEDQRGVRSIVEGGMRSTEPVGLAPGGGISTDRVAHPEYEPAPVEPATSVDHFEPPAPEPAPPEAQTDPRRNFINAAKDRLAGDGFRTILEARALAREHGVPFDENKVENKEIDELVERAVVERARELVDEGASPQETFAKMMRLYDNQPNLSTRTSTSIAEQAYSTPAPLAYVASRLAGIDHDTYVLEPTAGNGMLLMEADPRRTRINELNGARARSLTEQGFQPTSDDAAAAMAFSPERGRMDVVIANPPFGIVREGGKAKVFSVEGFNSTQIDHAISMNALTAMKADGKAVLIIGGVKAENEAERAAGYQVKAKRRFFHELLKNYKVSDVFTVSGDLYVKQGAGWPVDVITIEGRGPSERDPLTKTPPPLLKTWEEVGEKLNGLAERPVSSPEAGDRGQGIYAEDRGPSGEVAQGGPGPAGGNALGGAGVGRGEPSGLQPAEGAAPGPVGELDGSSNSPEPGPDGSESPLSAGAGSAPGQGGELRGPNPQPSPERGRSLEGEVTEGQTPYEPASQLGVKLDTLLPANLRNATFSSLDRLEREHGDVDHYVASSLGYPTDERGMFFLNDKGEKVRPFSAEQIDAIGLGISNIDKGEGFIIGDQTGIGKGRVVAGMISYAKSHGMVPVFVTEKPDLYGDMWRDLHDIGWDKQLGRPINMVMTNSSTRVPLDDVALEWIAERDEAKENGQPGPPRRGAWSASQDTAKASAGMNAVLNGTANADVVFTTYDQMNSVKGAETDRRRFLRAVAPKSFLIMDEAHNAGGTKPSERGEEKGAEPRSKVFRDAIAKARSVMYSSATYAKNPTVMTLYSKTDMVKAVENPAQLPDLIEKGGVPLQQVVASMLARAGQYMRRERSFQGVDYAQESVPVSDKAYGEFTTGLRSVFQFDTAFAKERDKLAEAQAAEHGGGTAHDTGTGETGASSTSFSSIMHNVISQMIMALKAEKAGERAVEALKAGEKPIIGLSKTNASFIDDFLADQGIAPGEVTNINFSHILSRYLERTRRVTIKLGNDESMHYTIPLEDMSAEAQAQYHAAEDALERMEIGDLPISPIDAMRSVIQRAGYTVKEVTGRKTMLDYSGSNEGFNNPTVVQRPASETGPSGKKMTVKAFNFGKLDAIVLNRSGSTGISLHAGKNFSDQRPRRMIIAEADPNIDTHMQMLGRIHRTGQVVLPSYTHLTADIPAEVRPTAVLMRKMASLNANTTGAAKSRFSSEGVDFLNKYGDRVVESIFMEDPMLMLQLGIHDIPEGEPAGLAARATGRLTLLNPEDQEAFLDKISELYNQQIEALDASGTNDLEAKSMDLRAKVLDSRILKPATGPSPFQGEVSLDRTSIKSQGRAMAPSEAQGMIEDAKKVDHATRVQQAETAARTYLDSVIATLKTPEAKEGARKEFNGNLQRFKVLTRTAEPGELVRLTVNGEEMPALVVGLSHKAGAKSPIALSSWNAMFALPSGQRSLGVSLSRLGSEADQIGIRPDYDLTRGEFDQQLEEARKEGRENRFMISGNLLAGYDQVGGHGQIITHTMEDGSTRPAVLMNRQFNAKDFMSRRAIRFNSGEHIMRYLDAVSDPEVKSTDGIITVTKGYRGYEFEMPAAKALGGRYFTDSTVRNIFDNWKKQGSKMRATVDAGTATKLLDAFRKIDAVFETRENQDVAATLGDLHPAAEAVLNQGPAELEQGRIVRHGGFTLKPGDVRGLIDLTRHADASTFMEEAGHDFLHQVDRDVLHPNAPDWFKGDYATTLKWLGVTRDQLFELKPNGKYTPRAVKAHEKYAAGFQQYLWEGRAPSAALARVFERFKTWLMGVYKTIKSIPHLEAGLNDDMRQVFDRMLAAPEPKPAIIAPTQPARPTFSDIHAADIVEAQPGPASEAASDRVAAEATQREKEHVPAQQAIEAVQRTEAANDAGEATKRPDEEGFLEEGGGRSEPDSKLGGGGDGSGKELGRGGAGVSEGAATPAAAGARPVSGQPARPGAAAAIPHPESPDTFSRASGYEWSGNINRAYTDTPDHIWDVIRDTGEENDGFIGDRRGVVTNAETAQLADALGMTNDSLLQRHVGQAFNASEAFKARKLLIQSAYDVHAQMKLAATGNDEAVLNYVAARENHKLIQAQVAGITAEAGRALQSFKMISGEGADIAGAVDKIIRDGAGITLDQARREAKLGAAYTTPEQISRFMNDTRKPGFGDMIFEFWVNNLISGFATHSTYSIANQILSLMRAGPETAIAAGMGVARRSFGRTGERVRFGEVGRRLETMVGRGAIAGAQAAKESFLAGTTLRLPGEKGALGVPLTGGAGAPVAAASPTFQAGTFGTVQGLGEGFVTGAAVMQAAGAPGAPRWGFAHSNQGAIPDVKTPIGIIPAGTIQRLPSRSIAGIHSFFRGSNYLMEINALAYRRAMEEHEGMQQAGGGYNDIQFAARIDELKRNTPDDMMKAARDTATNATLMGAPGAVTQKLSQLVNAPINFPGVGPVKLFRFIDPFVNISSNIMKEGLLKRSPVGLLSQSIRDDLMGKNGNVAADMAAARMIAGTMLAATSVYLAHQGMVNGSGPPDRKLFNVWTQAGNLPHSVRIGDMWYGMNRLGPLGLLMSVAADLHDVAAALEPDAQGNRDYLHAGNLLQHAFTHNILDESFLRGPADLLSAIENPATDGERWIKDMGTSFLPFSVNMAQMARATDPYAREARTFMDAIKAKTPGLSESLWPRVSIWGQPMPNHDAVIHSGVTAIYKTAVNPDPVDAALLKLGLGVAPPRPVIQGVKLTDQQYHDYATLTGHMRYQRLQALVNSQIFRRSPGSVQHDLITSTVSQSKTAAQGWLFARYPDILRNAHKNKMDIRLKEDEGED